MIYTENYMNQKTVFGTESSMVGWGWNLPRNAETQRERILGHEEMVIPPKLRKSLYLYLDG